MTVTAAGPVDCAGRFSAELFAAAEREDRICIVNNDSAETHAATGFQERWPERFVDVGIAEQNLVGTAIGLANGGLRPFVHTAACFVARAMEQIKNAAYTDADVVVCGFVAGFAYGPLGGTHHAVEDLAWMRAIPRMRVLAPGSPNDTAAALRSVLAEPGPTYIRIISKDTVPELFEAHPAGPYGSGVRLREGGDVTLVGTGLMTSRLVEAADLLVRDGVRARVLHLGSVSPIDEEEIDRAAGDTGRLVVAEDHVVHGGLGSAVSEVVVRRRPVPVLSIGVPQEFAPVGPSAYLHEHFGLTGPAVAARVHGWLRGGGDR